METAPPRTAPPIDTRPLATVPGEIPRVTIPGLATVEQAEEVARLIGEARVEQTAAARFAIQRLLSLRDTGKHIYRKTVSGKEIRRRRARGKVAKASRKVNR